MHFIDQYGQFHVALSFKFSKDMNDIVITDIIIILLYIYFFFSFLLSITPVAKQKAVVWAHIHGKPYAFLTSHFL